MPKSYVVMESILGPLTIFEKDNFIQSLCFGSFESGFREAPSNSEVDGVVKDATELLQQAVAQLEEYFNGTRQSFDLPLAPRGTVFQQRVWKVLMQIPYGETASYGQVATAIGNPKSCRAVGMANGANPLPIIIPCHRVIGHNGNLVGYSSGLDIKVKLLQHEGVLPGNE